MSGINRDKAERRDHKRNVKAERKQQKRDLPPSRRQLNRIAGLTGESLEKLEAKIPTSEAAKQLIARIPNSKKR